MNHAACFTAGGFFQLDFALLQSVRLSVDPASLSNVTEILHVTDYRRHNDVLGDHNNVQRIILKKKKLNIYARKIR